MALPQIVDLVVLLEELRVDAERHDRVDAQLEPVGAQQLELVRRLGNDVGGIAARSGGP